MLNIPLFSLLKPFSADPVNLLWFAAAFKVEIDVSGSVAVSILGHRLVIATVGRIDVGNFQRDNIELFGILHDAHFEASALFDWRSFVIPE
jgi:hypothetical protein